MSHIMLIVEMIAVSKQQLVGDGVAYRRFAHLGLLESSHDAGDCTCNFCHTFQESQREKARGKGRKIQKMRRRRTKRVTETKEKQRRGKSTRKRTRKTEGRAQCCGVLRVAR
jgi:hypothetical protein